MSVVLHFRPNSTCESDLRRWSNNLLIAVGTQLKTTDIKSVVSGEGHGSG